MMCCVRRAPGKGHRVGAWRTLAVVLELVSWECLSVRTVFVLHPDSDQFDDGQGWVAWASRIHDALDDP